MTVTDDRAINPFSTHPVAAAPASASTQALVQREVHEIQAQMIVARNFPRDPLRATDRVINAFSRPALCEQAMYAYSQGGSEISDLSIRAAEEIARSWGNLRCGVAEVSRAHSTSECLAFAMDLETGFAEERRFHVRHWRDTKKGGYPITEEREIYNLIANFGARRKRACILSTIPSDVQAAAKQQIAITLRTKAEVTPERIASLLEKFATFGVSKEQLEKRIQRRIESMLPAQLLNLGRIFNSLADGMSTAPDWFDVAAPPSGSEQVGSAQSSRADSIKGKLRARRGADKERPELALNPQLEPTEHADAHGGQTPTDG
jgi:hypothetical protein